MLRSKYGSRQASTAAEVVLKVLGTLVMRRQGRSDVHERGPGPPRHRRVPLHSTCVTQPLSEISWTNIFALPALKLIAFHEMDAGYGCGHGEATEGKPMRRTIVQK